MFSPDARADLILKYWTFQNSQFVGSAEMAIQEEEKGKDKEHRVYFIHRKQNPGEIACYLTYWLWRKYERAGAILMAREAYKAMKDSGDLDEIEKQIHIMQQYRAMFGFSSNEIKADYKPPVIPDFSDSEDYLYTDDWDYERDDS